MEKAATRTRDIQFYSEKNQQMVCVHSRKARDFAKYLERQSWVLSYQTCVPLALDKLPHVNPVDIRKEYLTLEWTTDFVIRTADGKTSVREFVDANDFSKKAVIEKLELSRRYWAVLDISDWKLVISGEIAARQREDKLGLALTDQEYEIYKAAFRVSGYRYDRHFIRHCVLEHIKKTEGGSSA